MNRADKIAKRLHDKWGGVTEDDYDFPPRPPRMRRATGRTGQPQRACLQVVLSARRCLGRCLQWCRRTL